MYLFFKRIAIKTDVIASQCPDLWEWQFEYAIQKRRDI